MRELSLSSIIKAIRNTKKKNRNYAETSHLYLGRTITTLYCKGNLHCLWSSHIRAYISKHRLLDAEIFTSIREILVSYSYTIQY